MPEPTQQKVNVHEAKTHLSKLLERVEGGEEITIARNGKPVAKLVPIEKGHVLGARGIWKGKVTIRGDFDDLNEEIAREFGTID